MITLEAATNFHDQRDILSRNCHPPTGANLESIYRARTNLGLDY